ncbi:MAG TPA: hypothetical protein VIK91_27420 [Nannocystis sp.]
MVPRSGGREDRTSAVLAPAAPTAYLDGWADPKYCNQNPQDDDFKKADFYDCGAFACSYSAYVMDHDCTATNYC